MPVLFYSHPHLSCLLNRLAGCLHNLECVLTDISWGKALHKKSGIGSLVGKFRRYELGGHSKVELKR